MTTARTRNPNRPNRTHNPDQPIVAVPDTEYCCNGMITLSVEQLDNHQRNAYGTTNWATDYAVNRTGFPGDSISWEIMESWED